MYILFHSFMPYRAFLSRCRGSVALDRSEWKSNWVLLLQAAG